MKVQSFILEGVRNLYLPQFRNIVSAEVFSSGQVGRYSASIENPVCLAEFKISSGSYTVEKKSNAGCVDIQVCIAQIGQVAWAQLLQEGIFNFGCAEKFISKGLEGIFGVGSAPDIRNKRQIPTNETFSGMIRVGRLKEFEGVVIVEGDYDFNNRACFGTSKFYIESSNREQ